MAEQLGLQSLTIPEEFGGSGFSYVELIVVLEEMGAALLCAPFFSSVALAANALLTSGDEEAKKGYLPGIASGETIATLALTEDNGKWDFTRHRVARRPRRATAGRSTATRCSCSTATSPTSIVVAARTDGGVSLFAVQGDAAGLTRTPLADHGPDTQAGAARVRRHSRPRSIGSDGAPSPACPRRSISPPWRWPRSRWAGRSTCSTASVEYAKTRIQFGRPIGSFQAIKHKCADMLLEVESAKSAAYYAAWAAAEDSDELPVVASLGQVLLLGGLLPLRRREHPDPRGHRLHLGAPAHLYFKRAKSSELLLGDPSYHRELLAQRIGI